MHKDFIKNKYYNWYFSIIEKAILDKSRNKETLYLEEHHILPKSMGGTNDSNNLILLTPKEHFICHILLSKFTINSGYHKMVNAVIYFKGNSTSYINSRLYNSAKIKFSELQSKRMSGPKNPFYGKTHSDETKKYISDLNIKHWAEHTNPFYGKTHSDETKIQLSKIALNHEKIECIHCNKKVSPANYTQFHGDNCKYNPTPNLSFWENVKNTGNHFRNDEKIQCKYCHNYFGLGMHARWHGEKCKLNQQTPNK